MNELKAMTTSELRRFISVTKIALDHAKKTDDHPLAAAAQRDIDAATKELSTRA